MPTVGKVDLAFDVGGTKVFAASKPSGDVPSFNHIKSKIANENYPSLPELISGFVSSHGLRGRISRVFVDVNAPVNEDGSFNPTNGKFSGTRVTKKDIATASGVKESKVGTGNDMVAGSAGFLALEALGDKSNIPIFKPDDRYCTRKSINFMGTGYGHADLAILDDKVFFFPSEGGHIKWAPWIQFLDDYLQYCRRNNNGGNVVSREMVVRAEGVALAYDFFKESVCASEDIFSSETELDRQITAGISMGKSKSKIITDNLLGNNPDKIAQAAHMLYDAILAGIVTDEAMRLNGGEVIFGGSHFSRVVHRYTDDKGVFKSEVFNSCENLLNMRDLVSRTNITLATNPNMNILGALDLVNDVGVKKPKYTVVPSRV